MKTDTTQIIRAAIAEKRCPICGRYIRNAAGMGSHLRAHSRNGEAELKVARIPGEPQNSRYELLDRKAEVV